MDGNIHGDLTVGNGQGSPSSRNQSLGIKPVQTGDFSEGLLDAKVRIEELQLHGEAVMESDDRPRVNLIGAAGRLLWTQGDRNGVGGAVITRVHLSHPEKS